ncbi:D2LIC, cytoplasmic dynein 2 light intermediate chain [Tribonema minus]|uniref:Cytoplasmic dynein 2 light intermediate chain 1 n=1 Tax=Tribonema minus TaxID=303371 RepID=A0A835YX97_9STRA|nr:D2LIC, cytoplasmic dynein 2 light intermediate chain [Tribonema minus]
MARRNSFDDSASAASGNDVWSRLTRQVYGESGTDASAARQAAASDPADDGGTAAPATTVSANAGSCVESYTLCVGMPGSGKSSLLSAYLTPTKEDLNPKPTIALEYLFARRATASNSPKDIAHIWELGGGAHTSDLVAVPIGAHNFSTACYIVVVDLSRPSDIVAHITHWTDRIKASVKGAVRELAKADPTFADGLKRRTYAKFGREHPDLKIVKPCPVPLIFVANKYDVFRDSDSARRRLVGQALRFLAHVNGATLLCCSAKDKALKDAFRALLNRHLFAAPAKRLSETAPEKPLAVSAGADTFESILKAPPGATRYSDFIGTSGVMEGAAALWQRHIEEACGGASAEALALARGAAAGEGEGKEGGEGGADGGGGGGYPEPAVDEMRAQRDELLRRYRKEAERRAKLDKREAAPAAVARSASGGSGTGSAAAAARQRKPSVSSLSPAAGAQAPSRK